MEQDMQAFEIVANIANNAADKEKRSLAIQMYLSLVIFLVEEMRQFGKSVAFQVFDIPENAQHSVVIFPSQIDNLNILTKSTKWVVLIDVYTNFTVIHQALAANLKVLESILPLLDKFANKHSLEYNTNLEVRDFNELSLTVEFGKILSNE